MPRHPKVFLHVVLFRFVTSITNLASHMHIHTKSVSYVDTKSKVKQHLHMKSVIPIFLLFNSQNFFTCIIMYRHSVKELTLWTLPLIYFMVLNDIRADIKG